MIYDLILIRLVIIKKKKVKSTGQDVEKLEQLCITNQNVKWSTVTENDMFFKKLKVRLSNFIAGYVITIIESRILKRYLYTHTDGSEV